MNYIIVATVFFIAGFILKTLLKKHIKTIYVDDLQNEIKKSKNKIDVLKQKAKEVKNEKSNYNIDDMLNEFKRL